MPDIKNEDLVALHDQIEKAELEQSKLSDLLSKKTVELKSNRASKLLFKIISSALLLLSIGLIFYIIYGSGSDNSEVAIQINQAELDGFKSEMNVLKDQLETIKKNEINLKEIKDLYLYRKLIKKDTVYSVQIQAFSDNKIAPFSKKYSNALYYNDTSYYKFSLGIFETLSEAQGFREFLKRSGVVEKNTFVISYKDGKRLKIESHK